MVERFFIEAKTGRAYAIFDECSLERFFGEKSNEMAPGEYYDATGLFITISERTSVVIQYVKGRAVDKFSAVFEALSNYPASDIKLTERYAVPFVQQQTGYAWKEL